MQTFISNGVEIAFEDFPSAKEGADPIVLIHGFASNHIVNWVSTFWVKTLTEAGYRVITFDNRGHGLSDKLYSPGDYVCTIMAEDVRRLLDHLHISRADIMGYSLGARIAAHLTLMRPDRVRSLLLGGLGIHLINGKGLPQGIADAMEAPSLSDLTDPMQRMFRAFAEQTKSDLKALSACIRGARQNLAWEEVERIRCPVLVSVGTDDHIAGSPHDLAALIPGAKVLEIPGRDHNLAVGDKVHKQGVLAFLADRP